MRRRLALQNATATDGNAHVLYAHVHMARELSMTKLLPWEVDGYFLYALDRTVSSRCPFKRGVTARVRL